MLKEDKKHIEQKPIPNNENSRCLEKDIEPKPVEIEEKLRKPEKLVGDQEKHISLLREELEITINLCGSKRELIDVLNHVNYMFIETPKKVNSEIKVRKLK